MRVTEGSTAGGTPWPPVQRISRRQLLGWGAGGLVVLALPGCTAVREQEQEQGAGTGTGTASAATPTPTPTRGGTLTIAQSREVLPLAPVTQAIPNQSWRKLVYNTLIRLDRGDLAPTPELASEWTESDDGTVFTFTLNDGVTWHSGRPFSGEDVVFTVRSLASDDALPFPFKWLLAGLTDVTADGNNVTMTFSQPPGRALYDMLDLMIVIDSESLAGFVDGSQWVGTGPFRRADYQPGSELTLERNSSYWRPDRPFLDEVVIRFITRPEALVSGIRAGQVGLGLNLLPLDLQQFEGDGSFTVTQYDTFGQGLYLAANVNVAPLDRREVRQAVNLAVDRERINAEVFQGLARTTAAPWSPTSPAYDEQAAARYARDLDEARRLLDEAGAAGATVVLEVSPAVQSTSVIADIVAFNLGEVGLQTQITLLDSAQQSERFRSRSYQGAFIGVHGYNQLAPDILFNSAAPFRPGTNLSNFLDPAYEQVIAEASASGEDSAWEPVTDKLLDEAFCSDLVVATNNAVTAGVTGWDYTMWDELILDDATLA
jgi:peptide/nickel transport system substrate-binding protein